MNCQFFSVIFYLHNAQPDLVKTKTILLEKIILNLTQVGDAAAAAMLLLLLLLLLAGCLGIAHLSHFPVGAGQERLLTVALLQATTITSALDEGRSTPQPPIPHNTDDTHGKCEAWA